MGSPGTVIERLTEMHDELGGYGQLIGLFAIGTSTQEQTRRCTELFATEVIPALRSLGVATGAAVTASSTPSARTGRSSRPPGDQAEELRTLPAEPCATLRELGCSG